jgi:hypothetical protein
MTKAAPAFGHMKERNRPVAEEQKGLWEEPRAVHG